MESQTKCLCLQAGEKDAEKKKAHVLSERTIREK